MVVLSNSANGVDDIGQHLIDSTLPMVPYEAPKQRTAISVNPKVLDGYVGRYQLTPQFIVTVTRDEASLYVQATGQPSSRSSPIADGILPESSRCPDHLLTGPDGRATELILHQGGADQHLKRIE